MRRCFIITITFVILSSFFILMHLQVQFYSTNLEDQNSLAYSYTNDSQKNHHTKQDQNLSESSKTLDIGQLFIYSYYHFQCKNVVRKKILEVMSYFIYVQKRQLLKHQLLKNQRHRLLITDSLKLYHLILQLLKKSRSSIEINGR